MGPSLLGAHIEVTATVAEIEDRNVAFTFEVRDEIDQVVRGRHIRFVVILDKPWGTGTAWQHVPTAAGAPQPLC